MRCRIITLDHHHQDFYRPIITPYELEVALQAEQSWTGKYVLDFEKILAKYGYTHEETNSIGRDRNEDEDEDSPVFSLVTGKYRHAKRFGPTLTPDVSNATTSTTSSTASSTALVQRNQDSALALLSDSAAGEFVSMFPILALPLLIHIRSQVNFCVVVHIRDWTPV